MTNSQILDKFSNHVETTRTCGANICYSETLVLSELQALTPPHDVGSATTKQYTKALEDAKNKYLTAAFLASADR